MSSNQLTKYHIKQFLDYYSKKICEIYSSCLDINTLVEIKLKIDLTLRKGGKIFSFGNGGSFAIASTILFDLKNKYPPIFRRQIDKPLSIHEIMDVSYRHNYDKCFSEILSNEAKKGDLVILISSSGLSTNIICAAKQAKELGVDIVVFSNNITELSKLANIALYIPVGDQQIGEDLILIYVRAILNNHYNILETSLIDVKNQILSFIGFIDMNSLFTLAKDISNKYANKNKIFIFSPHGGVQNIMAQHVAHNLQWDAMMDIPRSIKENIRISILQTLSGVHFSRFCNDRDVQLFHARQLLVEGTIEDLLLLFGADCECSVLNYTLKAAKTIGMNVYAMLLSERNRATPKSTMFLLDTFFYEKWVYECCIQIFGHILGRLLRVLLLDSTATDIDKLLKSELAQLKYKSLGNVELYNEIGINL